MFNPLELTGRRGGSFQGMLGCPNKWNLYHECTDFCQRRWGAGRDPDPKLELKRLKMLEKYPLPPTWSEVYDPGT